MVAAFLTTVLFSLSAVTGNRCAKVFGGIEANFYRLFLAAVFLAIYVLVFDSMISGPASTMFALSGLVGVGCGDLLFFQALPRLGSRLTILVIQCLTVPFAAILEWSWMGTTLTGAQVLCIGAVLAGIAIALYPNDQGKAPPQMKLGLCLGILAALGNGLGAVLSRKAYFIAGESGFMVTGPSAAFQRVLGGIAVATVAILIARWPQIREQVLRNGMVWSVSYKSQWKKTWPWVISTSLAGQTLGVTCFQWALKNYPTGVVLPIVAMTPLVAIPITYTFEGERPTLKSFIGGGIAVGGVAALLKVA